MSRRRRQEEREGRTRESVRVSTKSRSGGSVRPSQSQNKDTGTRRQRLSSSDTGVRFTDLSSDPLHRSKQGSEGQGRYHSGEFTYKGAKEKERTRGGQRRYESKERRSVRSHSVEKEAEVERGHRRTGNKENRHSVHYDGEMEKQKERSTKISSRSKSHDIGEERKSTDKERSQRRQYEEREGSRDHYGESQESYHVAPFYLHSSNSQMSSHYGYERIQSLFYGSTEQIQQENAKLRSSKTEKISRERSGTHRESSPRKNRDSARKQNNKLDSENGAGQRQRSPRRRAAPAMPLPPAPSGPGRCSQFASLQSSLQCVIPILASNEIAEYGEPEHQYEAIPGLAEAGSVHATSQGEQRPPSPAVCHYSGCHTECHTGHT